MSQRSNMKRELTRLSNISRRVLERVVGNCYSCIANDEGLCQFHQNFADAITQARRALKDKKTR
jgi:hypothetical protein